MSVRKILFIPTNRTVLAEMSRLATRLSQKPEWKIFFLISTSFVTLKDQCDLTEAGVQVLHLYPKAQGAKEHPSVRFSKLIHFLKQLPLSKWMAKVYHQFVPDRTKMPDVSIATEEKIHKIFQDHRFTQVVLPSDRSLGALPLIWKVSSQLHIPQYIYQVSLFSDEERLVRNRLSKEYDVTLDKEFQSAYPNQVRFFPEFKKTVSFYPPEVCRLLDEKKILPRNPWVLGGSSDGKILVDSERTKDQLISGDVDPKRVSVVGHLAHDDIFFQSQKYEKDECDKIILGLPHLGEHGLVPWKKHMWFIRSLAEVLKPYKDKVLISLHPKMDKKNYTFLEKDYGFEITSKSLSEILPLGQIYLSTYSSTIDWAVLLGIPCFVVDPFHFEFSTYNEFQGVKVFQTMVEFEDNIHKFLNDSNYKNELIEFQREKSNYVGCFDGECLERVKNKLVGECE
jgi:hypothetical protein